MRKLFIVISSIFVVCTPVIAQADITQIGDPGQVTATANDFLLGEQIQNFSDGMPGEQTSYLRRHNAPQAGNDGRDYLEDPTCTSLADSRCSDGQTLDYQALLPYCQSASDVNCIVDFGTQDESGAKTSASFARYFPPQDLNQYQGDPAHNLPSGVAGGLYNLPGSPHAGGSQYYVAVVINGSGSAKGPFDSYGFEATVYPANIIAHQYGSGDTNDGISLNGRGRSDGTKYWGMQGHAFQGSCVVNSVSENMCIARYAFPANTRYYLKLRLGKSPGGWMHGRVSNPDISITNTNSTTDVEIAANPVAVPTVYKMYNWVDMPPALQANYDPTRGTYLKDPRYANNPNVFPGGRSAPNTDPLKRNVINQCDPWRAACMDQLKLWLPYVNNTATSVISDWSVRTLSGEEMSSAGKCFADSKSLTGIVTTNSTQYSAGPPTFNKADGSLTYQVASPHYATKGDVFKGTYDLVMRSDVARCVYGFSKAPVSATISVTGADGTAEVATTVVGESKGWLHLSANNFEFSAPTIQVKLTQAEPTPASVPTSTTAKAKTIACIKGKVTKQVTTTSCPAGYKRK